MCIFHSSLNCCHLFPLKKPSESFEKKTGFVEDAASSSTDLFLLVFFFLNLNLILFYLGPRGDIILLVCRLSSSTCSVCYEGKRIHLYIALYPLH